MPGVGNIASSHYSIVALMVRSHIIVHTIDSHTHTHTHTGAVNVNIVGILKKRFATGKIGLADLVTSDEGKEKFKVSVGENHTYCLQYMYSVHMHTYRRTRTHGHAHTHRRAAVVTAPWWCMMSPLLTCLNCPPLTLSGWCSMLLRRWEDVHTSYKVSCSYPNIITTVCQLDSLSMILT